MYIELLPEVEYKFNNLVSYKKRLAKSLIEEFAQEKINIINSLENDKYYLVANPDTVYRYIEQISGYNKKELKKEWLHYTTYLIKRCCLFSDYQIAKLQNRDALAVKNSIAWFIDNLKRRYHGATLGAYYLLLNGENLTDLELEIKRYIG